MTEHLNELGAWRKRKKELKQQYEALYNRLLEILFRLDPMGINFGSNADEYDPEVSSILPRLKECQSVDDVRAVILHEFTYWFGEDVVGEESDYGEVAREIWEAWNEP